MNIFTSHKTACSTDFTQQLCVQIYSHAAAALTQPCVLSQDCLTLLPKLSWMAQASVTPQTRLRAHWTLNGTSIMICEHPVFNPSSVLQLLYTCVKASKRFFSIVLLDISGKPTRSRLAYGITRRSTRSRALDSWAA